MRDCKQLAAVAILPHLEPLRVYGDDCIQQILVQLDPPEQIPTIQPVPRLCKNEQKQIQCNAYNGERYYLLGLINVKCTFTNANLEGTPNLCTRRHPLSASSPTNRFQYTDVFQETTGVAWRKQLLPLYDQRRRCRSKTGS